jgi:minor extracellular serine protease Vpr
MSVYCDRTWARGRAIPVLLAVSLAAQAVGCSYRSPSAAARAPVPSSISVVRDLPVRPATRLFASPRPDAPGMFSVMQATAPSSGVAGSKVTATGRGFIAYNLEFEDVESRERFAVPGATVYSHRGRFADIMLAWGDEDTFERVIGAPGIRCIELAGAFELPPPPPLVIGEITRAIPASPERIVSGGLDGLTGRGVIVGIIDNGVDFRNADFIDVGPEGLPESRILAMWDLSSDLYARRGDGLPPPVNLPDGTPLGTVFDRAMLTRAVRTGAKEIPATDLVGHGTACAGIAVGNGRSHADGVGSLGVAPRADLIVVRLSATPQGPIAGPFLGAACGWVDSIATALGRPLVISCSFGSHAGPHDGSTVAERQLEARFPDSAVGRALCVAAGNEGEAAIHAEVTIGGSADTTRLAWQSAEARGRIEIHLRKGSLEDLRLGQIKMSDSPASAIIPVSVSERCTDEAHRVVLDIEGSEARILLTTGTGVPIEADVYVVGGTLSPDQADPGHTISRPGTCRGAITVGSYVWNEAFEQAGGNTVIPPGPCADGREPGIGKVSCYSSQGYGRDGTIKPDILAPGEVFVGSLARTLEGAPVGIERDEATRAPTNLHASGNGRLFRGTSAATPYVAGVIALMLERDPGLTSGRIKELLLHHATEDRFTGKVPDPRAGHGKLDLVAVKAILADVPASLAPGAKH